MKEKGKVADNGDVIFYNSMKHKSGAIWLTGDNRTGDAEGDDEQIIVKLDQLPNIYQNILFVVQIYEGAKKIRISAKSEMLLSVLLTKTERNLLASIYQAIVCMQAVGHLYLPSWSGASQSGNSMHLASHVQVTVFF